ncbi:T9SS type A sorting domain-containing protein [Flavobacterium sp. PLA-1-15]|uniref:T9SS type A sorting domain-containing protein n=1 Tax=Flavobacterium sp. PLA-1-15 TaxID=3380533 RepID=UPI003B788ACD
MKRKLFLLGLLSFLFVNGQVVRLIDLPAPIKAISNTATVLFSGETATTLDEDPPANDECDGAIQLTVNSDLECQTVTTATITGATDSGIPAEAGTADDDVWFSFVATNEMHKITLDNFSGDNDDMVMEVMTGDCSDPTLVAYVDDPNALTFGGLEVDNTYYIRIYSYTDSPQTTTFDICLGTPPPAPANDECDTPTQLTVNPDYLCGTVTAGTLQSATDSGIEGDLGDADDDVWFSFTATSETHKIELSNIEAGNWSGFDIVMELLEGDCSTIIESDYPESMIVSGLTPETEYKIRVYSYGEDFVDTTFDICVGTPPAAPANDECATATAITMYDQECTATSGTLQSATDSGTPSEVGEADDDVWYSFVAASNSALITLDNIDGNTYDLVFELFEGDCDALSSLKIVNGQMGAYNELVTGSTYYVRIFSYGEENFPDTTFDICITTSDAPPANDNCEESVELTVAEGATCQNPTSGTLAFATDSGIPTETGSADDDVWYHFTATSTTHKIELSNIEGNDTDLVMELFDGQCGGILIGASDPNTFIVNELIEETVYYVRVYSYGPEFVDTTFDICLVAIPAQQENDECDNPVVLTVNDNGICETVTTASLANATDSGIDAEEGNPNDDVWFSFVATGPSHQVSIPETDGWETLNFEVFSGLCGEFTSLGIAPNYETLIVSDMTVGDTYFVRVFSYSDEPVYTVFDICVTKRQDPPANDECDGAIALTVDASYCNGVLNNGTNLGATDSNMGQAECFNYGENDVWFSFTVPENVASVDISTDFTGGTLLDTEIALYSGSCSDLTEMDCDQDSGETILSNDESYNSIITNANVEVGETYYVRVSGYNASREGTFCLEISTNETLSSDDFTKNSLKAYPNPVKNILNLNNPTAITDVAVFNLLGQQVVAKVINANEGQIDMSNLAPGAYLVKVTADNAVQTIKIIKE